MNEFDNKIQQLGKEIADARFKVDTALRSTVIFYIIIIVGVTFYTLYLSSKIQQLATPQTVATMIGSAVKEQMPKIQQQLVQQAKLQAPILAKKTIDSGEKLLPQAEMLIKSKIDAGVASIVDHTFNAAMPVLVERIKGNFDEISKHKNLITDKKTSEAIADLLSVQIASELDKVIDSAFYNELTKFQKDIDAIAQGFQTDRGVQLIAEFQSCRNLQTTSEVFIRAAGHVGRDRSLRGLNRREPGALLEPPPSTLPPLL